MTHFQTEMDEIESLRNSNQQNYKLFITSFSKKVQQSVEKNKELDSEYIKKFELNDDDEMHTEACDLLESSNINSFTDELIYVNTVKTFIMSCEIIKKSKEFYDDLLRSTNVSRIDSSYPTIADIDDANPPNIGELNELIITNINEFAKLHGLIKNELNLKNYAKKEIDKVFNELYYNLFETLKHTVANLNDVAYKCILLAIKILGYKIGPASIPSKIIFTLFYKKVFKY